MRLGAELGDVRLVVTPGGGAMPADDARYLAAFQAAMRAFNDSVQGDADRERRVRDWVVMSSGSGDRSMIVRLVMASILLGVRVADKRPAEAGARSGRWGIGRPHRRVGGPRRFAP